MTKIIDVSLSINANLPVWPGSIGFSRSWTKRIADGDSCNNSSIVLDSHVGTHIDAPMHFIENGKSIDEINIKNLVGPCTLLDIRNVKQVLVKHLESAKIPCGTRRLLIRTDNSNLYRTKLNKFETDFVSISPAAAQWIANQEIRVLGFDYLSVGQFGNGDQTHQILLGQEIIIIEGLNLDSVTPGNYELLCLPMKIDGAEGAPARVLLIQE